MFFVRTVFIIYDACDFYKQISGFSGTSFMYFLQHFAFGICFFGGKLCCNSYNVIFSIFISVLLLILQC